MKLSKKIKDIPKVHRYIYSVLQSLIQSDIYIQLVEK